MGWLLDAVGIKNEDCDSVEYWMLHYSLYHECILTHSFMVAGSQTNVHTLHIYVWINPFIIVFETPCTTTLQLL